jgi:hypothetical protein
VLTQAYFFPVKELDMVWRSVMHAHLFKGRFGETIEFHTASGGAYVCHESVDSTFKNDLTNGCCCCCYYLGYFQFQQAGF